MKFLSDTIVWKLSLLISTLTVKGYVSVKSKLQHAMRHPPLPGATPWAFNFFENYCSNFPLPGPKCRSSAPH